MSTQVSHEAHHHEIIRRTANFHPSIWGDQFISHLPKDKVREAIELQEIEKLREQFKRELLAAASNSSQQLDLIDAIQRLGVAYHFETEIEEALHHIYNNRIDMEDDDLYNTALGFRLLRQHGYNVSCDIFNKFKDDKGYFKQSNDARGILGLYEAAHLAVHGEDILDEALAFTTIHLKSMASSPNCPLTAKVSHALKQPIRRGVPRLESRRYISIYQDEPSCNKTLLRLAKLNFNLVQDLHKEELAEITSEIEEKVAKEGWSYRVHYGKDAMKVQVHAYFNEAKWFHENHIPTMEEYMQVALVTSGYFLLATVSFIGMADMVTEQAFDWVFNRPKIVRASETIARLVDDVRSHKGEPAGDGTGEFGKSDSIWDTRTAPEVGDPAEESATSGETGAIGDTYKNKGAGEGDVGAEGFVGALDLAKYGAETDFEQERGHAASGVECYIRQYGLSKQEVYKEFHMQVVNAWKDVNEECLKPTAVPMPLLERILNLSRVTDVIYKEEDGYTHVGQLMKNNVASLFIDSVPI
ncbi:hypothetical protein POTOM_049499 [Populus tomentosa]|uniref:Uncharacterized protein n=1 Tax=Populus tomentosa TaxID=118781 RepID=A0A8X7YAB7_POPTO|nr:hypothetical protein POTOM_049499 [Populus tomentosa]